MGVGWLRYSCCSCWSLCRKRAHGHGQWHPSTQHPTTGPVTSFNQRSQDQGQPPHRAPQVSFHAVRVAIISRAALGPVSPRDPRTIPVLPPVFRPGDFPAYRFYRALLAKVRGPLISALLLFSGTSAITPPNSDPPTPASNSKPVTGLAPSLPHIRSKEAQVRGSAGYAQPTSASFLDLTLTRQIKSISESHSTPTSPRANHCFLLQAAFAVTGHFQNFKFRSSSPPLQIRIPPRPPAQSDCHYRDKSSPVRHQDHLEPRRETSSRIADLGLSQGSATHIAEKLVEELPG